MKYVKQFDEHDDYTLYVEDDPVLPNVSKCDAERHVHYNPKFVSVPLTFDIKSDGVIKWTAANDASPLTIKYSKNGGEWTNISSSTTGAEIAVNSGDIVQFKGSNSTYCTASDTYSSFEKNTIVFNVYGNIMSLIDENNYNSLIEFPSDTANNFYKFFYACKNLLSAKNLVLPALTLSTQCYNSLFNECRSLKIGPQLPATTISAACYANMFRNCTSLTEATYELPALTMMQNCYYLMFSNCLKLTKAPRIKATTAADYCCYGMFNNCESLVDVQDTLYPTTVYDRSYFSMFNGCTSLSKTIALPATTLGDHCYTQMFVKTKISTAPALPAMVITPSAYLYMFQNCKNLVVPPILNATVIGEQGYACMFEGCSSMTNFQSVLPATSIGNSAYTFMFSGCSNITSAPEVMVEDVPYWGCRGMFEYTGITIGPKIHFKTLGENAVRNFVRGCSSLTTAYMSNITSVGKEGAAYFYNADNLVTIENIDGFAPTTVGENGCEQAFSHSPKLTTFPSILPATTLTKACYINMFEGCTAMTKAPTLPAATLLNQSYQAMFWNCTNLKEITCLATDRSAAACTYAWMQNVPAGGTFKKAASATWGTGASGIPSGWTVQDV